MTDPLSPTPLSEQERVALVTMLRDGPNHRDWPERYVEVMGFINRLSSAPTPLSEQEIRVGDRFLWEPSKPYATEHCVVTRVEGKGVWSRSWVPTSKISGGYTGPNVWNEVDRFREAAVPLARLSPGVAEPPVEHRDHTDPSLTLHLPGFILSFGRLKQPGFRRPKGGSS